MFLWDLFLFFFFFNSRLSQMSSDFTFQLTQGFSNIYECKWGNIKVSSSDPYILIAFYPFICNNISKSIELPELWTMNLFHIAAPSYELGKSCLAWHRFAVTLFVLWPLQHQSTQKKVKSFEINWQSYLLPPKMLELWMKLSCTFELHLFLIFDASRTSRKSCSKRHTFGCYREGMLIKDILKALFCSC